MPKYIVIHPFRKRSLEGMLKLPPEKNVLLKNLKSNGTDDADWVRSWAVPGQGKLYCEWNAKDPESIRAIFEKGGGGIEIEAIYEMQILEGEDFKEKVIEAIQ
ncbi:MAG: nickel-binding protein [Promethearchaeota archaeon]